MGPVLSCFCLRKEEIPKPSPGPSIALPDRVGNATDPSASRTGTNPGPAAEIQDTASNAPANKNKVSDRSAAARVAAEGLKLALNLADKALDGLPIPGAKGSVGILLKLIEDAEKVSSNADTLRQLQAHVKFLSANALEPLQMLSEDEMPSGMKEDVKRLVATLEEVGKSWTERAKRSEIRRWIEVNVDEKELKEFADDVKQAVEQFQFATAIRGRLSDRKQEKQLENIYSAQKARNP
ncbi:hypothetical protein GGX14DRAFT_572288 [Mycena pura]|uniref:Uncharacterized protein n=1 Tax=Mycena pura TaxID=153505 RepID=A0AAD6V581_9AGAR|nr:hypothetical protein GGX14DRAFT_572288 [Mycena pura]